MSAPRRILITGAAGFVGRHLVAEFSRTCPDAVLATEPFDMTDGEAVRAAVRAFRPDGCVHLAAVAALPAARLDPERAWRVNLGGTLTLARSVLSETPACRFLYVSSAEAYGLSFRPGLPLDETAALAPMNTYAATKAAAEMGLCALAASGLRVIRLRPFNHTGPGQREDFVVPAFAGQIARIEAGLSAPEMLVGNLDSERDFLDIADVCAAYIALIRKFDELPNNLALNISTGQTIRIGAILEKLLALTGETITIRQDPARLRPSEILRAAGDPAEAARLLNWRPRKSLDETIAAVLDDARRQTADRPGP